MYNAKEFPIWIVSDCRRKTDIQYFKETYNPDSIQHVRVEASRAIREARGWQFQANVDDAESECGLDDVAYDLVVKNDGDEPEDRVLQTVIQWVKGHLTVDSWQSIILTKINILPCWQKKHARFITYELLQKFTKAPRLVSN